MKAGYVIRRTGQFLAVVWAAATLNFFLPRLVGGRDPVREKLGQLVATGGLRQEGIEEMVEAYRAKFGLDRPIHRQYLSYLRDTLRLDLGYSLSNYPARVGSMIADALPWTIGLLFVSTVLGFIAGTLLGGIAAWPRRASPRQSQAWPWRHRGTIPRTRFVDGLLVSAMAVSAIPYYLVGLVLVYLFGLSLGLFPISGGHSPGATAGLSFGFVLDVLHHSILPALSIVVTSAGFWALGMRGMMVTTLGEDYIKYAEANGLRPRTVFLRFAMRNAMLPQFTSLGLSLGYVVSGSVLVEVVFAYPGVGTLLFRAISVSDFTLIHGLVLMIVLAVGLVTLALDLVYPLLDPRVGQERSV